MTDLVEVSLSDDYYTGPHFTAPPGEYGHRATLPREQVDRWQKAVDDYEDAQYEMREAMKAAREATRHTPPTVETSRCYWANGGIRVHVKPGCMCSR